MLSDRHARLTAVGRLLVATVVVVAAAASSAQQLTPSGYRPYPLRHASAEQIVQQVRDVVGGLGEKAEVLVDRQMNRLLIQGSDEVQRLAAQTLSALDRPAPADNGAAKAQPVVRAYRIAAEDLEATAADLRRRWPDTDAVRIASDVRGSQIVVVATPAVQAEISQKLAPQTGVHQAAAGPAPPPGSLARRNLSLKHISWASLEDSLRRLWGAQLRVSTRDSGELATLRLPAVIGLHARVHVDRRRNEVTIEGPKQEVDAWVRIIEALDVRGDGEQQTQLLQMHKADPRLAERAVSLMRSASARKKGATAEDVEAILGMTGRRGRPAWGGDLLAAIFQQADQGQNQQADNEQPAPAEGAQPAPADGEQPAPAEGAQPAPPDGEQPAPPDNQQPPAAGQVIGGGEGGPPIVAGGEAEGGFIGPVQIEFIEGLDVIILKGHQRDVARVARIIEEIERLTDETQPVVEIVHLEYLNSEAMAELITEVYDQILSPRAGQVSITALTNPNALLLIGREDSLQTVINMIRRIDQPSDPSKLLRVFALRHMSAVDAEERLTRLFADPTGLGTRLRVVSDYRSNTLVVEASPRDMDEVATILKGMDVSETPSTQQIKIFKLRNTLASNLAPVLQDAINGQLFNAGRSTLQQAGAGQVGQAGAAQPGTSQIPSRSLQFIAVDAEGGRLLKSDIMFDVRVTADTNANSLIVTAPAGSMELIGALIEQLDQIPNAQSQIKVFTLINGDATVIAGELLQIFGQAAATGGAFGGLNQAALQSLVAGGDNTLIPLRFAVDARTNSILVTGSPGNLNVVEALLIRLDDATRLNRKTVVYRLKNAPAADVAAALQAFLANQTALRQVNPILVGPQPDVLIARQVIIQPELISNSLIVSATPKYFESIRRVIEQLDWRPPMVAIQVVIAEVTLGSVKEFGVEFGVQDALLFDRGIATTTPAIRFDLNQAAIGNDNTTESLATRNTATGQLLSNLNVGRSSANAAFGGLVLSVGNDSVNALLRALKQRTDVQILSRPQVMTLENQPAFVVVGQEVRLPSGTVSTITSVQQNIAVRNVGIVLGVTPRTTPDGVVVMEVDAERSSLGSADEGTVIGFSDTGEPITVPPVNLTTTATTVRARSGQTVVLAGLIRKEKTLVERGIPLLGDIPIAGRLFRFNSNLETRAELLIIMTPFILYEDSDADAIKQVETERMNWSLEQVIEMHGDIGVGPYPGNAAMVPVIYPDLDPGLLETMPSDEDQAPAQSGQPPQREPSYSLPTPTPAPGGAAGSDPRPPVREAPPIGDAANGSQASPAAYWPAEPGDFGDGGVRRAGYQSESRGSPRTPARRPDRLPQRAIRPLPPVEETDR
jgi:general secretion pathway protein D